MNLTSLLRRGALSLSRQQLLLQAPRVGSRIFLQNALISTSKNNKDGGTAINVDQNQVVAKNETKLPIKKRYWISYGFSLESEEEDRLIMNSIFFWTVTVCLTILPFIMTYWPDIKKKDWVLREAYIELAKREAAGQLPIDPNFVPVENINLPSEEELGDFNIIV